MDRIRNRSIIVLNLFFGRSLASLIYAHCKQNKNRNMSWTIKVLQGWRLYTTWETVAWLHLNNRKGKQRTQRAVNQLVNWEEKKANRLRACSHGGGGPQIGEVTCGGSPHLSCKRDQIKMRDYMDRRVTPPKRVTSLTWGPPPPYKQALN